MSGINKITDKIVQDAKDAAAKVKADAEARAKEILAQANSDVKSKKSELKEAAEQVADMSVQQIISAAKMDAKKCMLGAKQEVVNEAFVNSVKRILYLPDEEYVTIVDKMVKAVPDSENMELEMLPRNGELLKGGFLLKRGDVTLNYSFKAIADEVRGKIEQDVIKMLGW